MRFIIALLLCVQVLLISACGDEKGDLIPPNLSLNDSALPYLQEPTSDPVIPLSGTTDPDASIEVAVSTAAKIDILINSGGIWSFDLSPVEGPNYVTISASDKRGNYNRMPLVIIHDKTPPVVSINQYLTPTAATSQIVGGIVDSGTFVDPGSTVEVSVDTAATVGTITVNNNFWSCELSGLVLGDNLVSVTATDTAGNVSVSSASRTIKVVDNAEPQLTVDPVDPTPATMTTLNGSKEPNSTVTVVPPTGVTAVVTSLVGSTSWSCDLSDLKQGNNQVTVTMSDAAPQAIAGVVVVRDDVQPSITKITPFSGYTTSAAAVTEVTATFNEVVDPLTINATTFLLKDSLGSDILGVVSYDPATRTASYTPTGLPLADGTYTATVTTGVKDLLGNAMRLNKVWPFTIKAP